MIIIQILATPLMHFLLYFLSSTITIALIARILKENPELYQLYRDLVVDGVISAEEFWENRGKVCRNFICQ